MEDWFPELLPKDSAKDAKFRHHLSQFDRFMCSNKIVLLDRWTDPIHKDVCFSLLGISDPFQNLQKNKKRLGVQDT